MSVISVNADDKHTGDPTTAAAPLGGLFLLACSQRAGGNTDAAARLYIQAFADRYATARPKKMFASLEAPCHRSALTLLRTHRIIPCHACGTCFDAARLLAARHTPSPLHSLLPLWMGGARGEHHSKALLPFGCPLILSDQSALLLRSLATAPFLCIVSPIYFYHLPAVLKALLDRTQCFWALLEAGLNFFPDPPRPCGIILAGARNKGSKLFEGSLLTLKYSLRSLNIHLLDPLLLYGLDAPEDLSARPDLRTQIVRYGEEAGEYAVSCQAWQ